MILCFALGIANIFNFTHLGVIPFSAICLYVFQISFPSIFLPLSPSPLQPSIFKTNTLLCRACSFIILFIEVPLLLRICPTSSKFDNFIRRFSTNYMRAAIYGVMSVVQWVSIAVHPTSLIAAAVVLLLTGAFYGIAALRKDEFMSSKTLGGAGVAQMIV